MRSAVWWMGLIAAAWLAASPETASAFGRHRRCGGCSDPCYTSYAPAAAAGCAMPAPVCLDTGPMTELHVVLVPSYVTEKQSYCTTEYREEPRTRVVTGYKTVQVNEERVRVYTVPTTRTETKTIEYTAQVAVQGEQKKSYKMKVPVWSDQEEKYTVKVPVIKEVQESYLVKVPVLTDVPFTYTVNVPYSEMRPFTRTVSSVVPVVKTRTVSYCVPVTRTRSVKIDRGHWENRMVEIYASGPIQAPAKGAVQAPKGGAVQAPTGAAKQAPVAVECRQVWVPDVAYEEVTEHEQQQQTAQVEYMVYEQHYQNVPYECPCIAYRPENRTGTKKEVVYQNETRTRPRTVVEYQDQPRTRMKKVLSFKEEERTEAYPVITYANEKRSKEVTYTVCVPESKTETYTVTRCEQVPEHKVENYTVRVCVPVVKEVEVRVCKMVPKVVAVTVNPCPAGQPCGVKMVQAPKWSSPQQAPPKG